MLWSTAAPVGRLQIGCLHLAGWRWDGRADNGGADDGDNGGDGDDAANELNRWVNAERSLNLVKDEGEIMKGGDLEFWYMWGIQILTNMMKNMDNQDVDNIPAENSLPSPGSHI